MGLFDSSNEQICATTDKYSLDKEDKEEMLSDYIEAYGKNSDIVNSLVNIFKNSDSYYHFDTQDCKSAAFVYLFAYVLSEVMDVFLVDHYNGYDMVGNDLKIAFDSAKSYINSNDNDNDEMNFDETIDVSNSLDIVEKNLKEINKKIEKAIGYISSQDFDKAKKLLNSCTSLKYVYPKSDLESPFYTFNDLLEYYCSKNVLKSDIEHKWFRTRWDEVYKLLGQISVMENNYYEAHSHFAGALSCNPMNIYIMLELANWDIYRGDLKEASKWIWHAYKRIYRIEQLSCFYRFLAFYYMKINDYELAYSVCAFSLYYEEDPSVYSFLKFIKESMKDFNYKKNAIEILDILKEREVPTTISDNNIKQLENIMNDYDIIKREPHLKIYISDLINVFTKPIDSEKLTNKLNMIDSINNNDGN